MSSDSDLSEHLARTRFFLEQSRAQNDAEKRSRFLMASIYPARAVIEIIIDRIKRGRLKGDFRDFLAEAAAVVRYFKAIEYLRDHDFHRNAIQFIPGCQSLYGPIKLSTGNSPQGAAAMGGRPGEPMEESTAKTGYVKQDRPLQIKGFEICVEDEGWVEMERILEIYLRDVETFIEAFLQQQIRS